MDRIYKALEKAVAISGLAKDPLADTMIITDRNERVDRRKGKRYLKRLIVKIGSEKLCRSGIMKDVSGDGMFVMSSKDFTKDMVITIELPLPNNEMSFLTGIITRNVEIDESNWLTGVGIKFIEKDETFHSFLTTLT
jgi:hypothetical protein